jgi:hypothetical protein
MMNLSAGRFSNKPIALLIAFNIIVGIIVFRDYGLSWDEPLFYDYGEALGYAYSPREWFGGNFDLENSYGASGEDHKTRGPAYLFLARNFVHGLEALGSDSASAWHLINFLFFQLGVYFLHRLALRWMNPFAALAASAFFSWQPLLWGHAFINPKDPPFLVFFLASICLGFEMVDAIAENKPNKGCLILAAGFCLGIATSIRVLGPLAGLLVIIYAAFSMRNSLQSMVSISRPLNMSSPTLPYLIRQLLVYALIAIAVMLATWPYLWENPPVRFFEVLRFMADNPTQLSVLFNGEVFRADDMPRRYLPFMLGVTLTEPAWFLFLLGLGISFWTVIKKNKFSSGAVSLSLTLSWFILVLLYVIARKPAIYDGLRHFLFVLPPVFIFSGFAFEWIGGKMRNKWLRAGALLFVLSPGLIGIIKLHPYEYTYYNSFVGGTSGVFRSHETDYWLTCYKEAVDTLENNINGPVSLFVHREAYIAEYYANDAITVRSLRESGADVKPGDYILVNTRTNEDRSTFRDAPPVLQIARGDAVFCVVKQVP